MRLLLIPGVNDDPELLRRTADWLADLDPLLRLKLIGFRPHGVRPNNRELVQPSAEQMARYRATFVVSGHSSASARSSSLAAQKGSHA